MAPRGARGTARPAPSIARPFDVVVVGAGFAGCVAALRAQELGCRTLLLDKADEVSALSNTVLSGGTLHFSYTHVLAPEAELRAKIAANVRGGGSAPALVDAVAAGRARAMAWLTAQGVGLQADPAGAWRTWLAPFRQLTSVHAWRDRGPDGALAILKARLAARGGVIAGGATALELVPSPSRGVAGVLVRRGGKATKVAARAVLLADGGFQANQRLVTAHIGRFADRAKLRAAPAGTGDGLLMAEALRAKLVNLQYFYGHLLHRSALTDDHLWPYPELDPLLAHGILVGGDGARIADEGRGGVAMANVVVRLDDPRSTWLVLDEAGWGTLRAAGEAARGTYRDVIGHLDHAGADCPASATLAGLAAAIGLDAAALAGTVASYNAAHDAGTLAHAPIPRTGPATPLRRGPFHAVPVVPGITFTMGGPLTDGDGRIVDLDGRPIPGLFAAGSTAGGLQGGPYGGYVGGLSPGLVFGILAADRMALDIKGAPKAARAGRPSTATPRPAILSGATRTRKAAQR